MVLNPCLVVITNVDKSLTILAHLILRSYLNPCLTGTKNSQIPRGRVESDAPLFFLCRKSSFSYVLLFQDFTSGLSWKEETELNKALYASLQEVRKQNSQSNSEAEDDPEEQVFPSRVRVGRRVHPKNLTLKVKRDKDALAHCKDESSQDSVRSSEAEAARESYKR